MELSNALGDPLKLDRVEATKEQSQVVLNTLSTEYSNF